MRAAQAIIDAVTAPDPPFHLLLGAPALDMARRDLEAKRQEFNRWEATTLGADYPASGA